MKYTSLEDLSAIKKKFPQKKPGKPLVNTAQPAMESRSADPPNTETDLFDQAMAGVTPITGDKKGRQIPGEREEPVRNPLHNAVSEDLWVTDYLRNLVQGNENFELSYSDEYMHGYVQGLDRKILGKLKAGQFSVEAHLDMHGLNALQARDATHDFLRAQYHMGRRCVLLITGRGRNSPGGQPLIREELPAWLTRDPLRRVVLAFCTALPQHGGAGALYILLRKKKKTQGKVRWDLPAAME
jgi:DNA-nicking Smr family endonuclease